MQVTNPGSAGSGTVQTDGVTIQGDGSAGNKIAIKQVETDSSLTGAGTLASPLKVAGQPFTFFCSLPAGATTYKPTASNNILISGFKLDWPVTFSRLAFYVNTADGANNSDFGIYSQAGTLLANIGAAHYGSTGLNTAATLQGAQTFQEGLYIFAFTSAANTLSLAMNSGGLAWIYNANVATSAGGVLNNSIAAQVVTPALNTPFIGLY
jgi:hypothetical protein